MYFPAFFFFCVSVIVMKISSTAYRQYIYQTKQSLFLKNTSTKHSFFSLISIQFEFLSNIIVHYFIQFCLYCGFIIQEYNYNY